MFFNMQCTISPLEYFLWPPDGHLESHNVYISYGVWSTYVESIGVYKGVNNFDG